MTTLRWDALTVDSTDPDRLADFWAALLGTTVRGRWEQYVGLHPLAAGLPRMVFQRVETPTPGKAPLHLDLHVATAAALDAEAERAVGLGARVVDRVEQAGQRWVVLEDPEGHAFCLIPDGP